MTTEMRLTKSGPGHLLLYSAITLATALAATGCGKGGGGIGSIVNGVQVRTYEMGGDLWGEMKANLSTGALILTGLNLPIIDPKNPGVILGNVAITSGTCGSAFCSASDLALSMNISKVLKTGLVSNTLPNGTAIPVGGIGDTAIIALPLKNTGARLYVGLGKNVALLGIAMPFREFDKIGQYVPGVNLFQPFGSEKDDVRGIVGIFTGAGAGQNGLALFVDLSKALNASSGMMAMRSSALGVMAMEASGAPDSSAAGVVKSDLIWQEIKPSKSKTRSIYRVLNDLNDERARLHLH